MCNFKVPEGWSIGYHDGYYTKVIKVGDCSVEINRPFLTDDERKKREEQVRRSLAEFGRAMYELEQSKRNFGGE